MTVAPRRADAPGSPHGREDVPVAPTSAAVWRRMHPITPVLKGWQIVAVLLVIVGNQVGDNVVNAQRFLSDGGWRWVLLALAATAVVGGAWASLAWRMTSYAVDEQAVHLRTGILLRQRRQARLDRLQAVDVVKPFLGRLFGLAKLTLEVAGGSGSAVELAFLKESEAEALRAELLARAAGIHRTTGDEPAPVAPEQQVFELAPTRLIGSLLLSSTTFVLVPALIGLTIWALRVHEVAPVLAMLPAVLGVGSALWARFAREFGFRAAISPDGIRLRHGLLEQRAQTVPPGRVQAVRVTQGPLWRGNDWWRVQINVAGYGIGKGAEDANVLLPVGSRAEAIHAIWLVLPDLGVPDPHETLDVALSGSGVEHGFLTMPRRSRWLDPWGWRRRGVLVTDRALLIRSGWFVRHLILVPHERTQSLALQQGPWQRAFGVSSVTVHSTPGPVSPVIAHLDAADATRLLTEQADRARVARAGAGPEQWMSRPASGTVDHA